MHIPFSAMIVRAMTPDWPLLKADTRDQIAGDVALFVERTILLAPAHVRAGVIGLSLMLGLWLAAASMLNRSAARIAWAFSVFQKLPMAGPAVIRVYRSMTVLAFYEHPVVAAAMGVEDAADRQQQFRAARARLIAGST